MICKTIYHTTTTDAAKNIKKHGFRFTKPSYNTRFRKKPGTLGYGVYGFSDKNFCIEFGKDKFKEPVVFEVSIQINENKIFDLTDDEHLHLYNNFRQKFMKLPLYSAISKQLTNHKQSELEGYMIEYLLENYSSEFFRVDVIECVKAMTVSQLRSTRNSHIANGTEYCVRKDYCIKNVREV